MLRLFARLALVAGVLVVAAACGKRGSPLAPIVRIPSVIDTVRTQRVGNDVYLTLTVPATNVDRSVPADIVRIDIYGYTGRALPPRGLFTDVAKVVASIPVIPPPIPGAVVPITPPRPEGAPPLGATVGTIVTVIDTLDAGELEQGPIVTLPLPRSARIRPLPLDPAVTAAAAVPGLLNRYYVAVPFSTRGEPGPQGVPSEVALFELPPAPVEVTASVGQAGTTLTWEIGGGLLGFLLDAAMAPEPRPDEDVFALPVAVPLPGAVRAPVAQPSGRATYNVYRRLGPPVVPPPPGTLVPPPVIDAPWLRIPPVPLNPAPLGVPRFVDAIEVGREHCYNVRAVRGVAPNLTESEPSETRCVTPADIFPPAVPARVVAVAAEGSISLIWEPGGDPDLFGYVILRGTPGDATLQPLTLMPVTEARFSDTTARPGTRYVYAVVAVDTATPPNMSAPSERVEETAR